MITAANRVNTRSLALRIFAEQHRVIAGRERDGCEAPRDLLGHGAQGHAFLHIAAHIDASLHILPLDYVRRRLDLDPGHIGQAHLLAVRGVEQQVLDVGHTVAHLGNAPHLHVVGLAAAEDVADFQTGDDGPRRAAGITRLEPILLGPLQIHFHLDLGLLGLQRDVQLLESGGAFQGRLHRLGLLTQHMQVVAEDAHRNRLVGPGQHLPKRSLR